MEFAIIVSFLSASLILTVMPGPDNIFVLTESLTKGHKNGIAISFGLGTGVLVHTIAAATGLSLIIQQSALAFSILKYLGAAYLLYMAFQSSKETKPEIKLGVQNSTQSVNFFKLIRKGFLMNVLNPKVSLFFIAFLPQFVSKGGFDLSTQMIILGILFMTQSILIFSLIALLSGRLTKYINSSKFWSYTKWGKISVLVILGTFLAIAKR